MSLPSSQPSAAPLAPVAEDLWGEPALAYHVQPGFAAGVEAGLARLQREAAALWPEPLLLAPPETLHVTLYALVPVRGRFDKPAYWSEVSDRTAALLRAAGAAGAPFTLHFRRLRATDAAIIALAEDPTGLIARLRAAIAAALPPPPGLAHPRYDIIHATLARHASGRPVPAAAVERLAAHPVDLAAPVERLKIVRETRYPCLVLEEIASFPLA
jgi:hypothetical protein